MDFGLQDKHAIVTGGSRGIGKAIARELAHEGADVAIVARNEADLEATARELAAETNRRIVPLAADVTSKEQVDRMVAKAAQQLGDLHILVNSGYAPGGSATATGPIEAVIDEDLLQDFNVKYVGALRCSRAVIPFMKTAGWGRIINISGGNARNAGNLSGGARNAGLVHMTKTLAVQLGRHGTYGPPRPQGVIVARLWSVCINVSGLGLCSRPRWRSAQPDPHNHSGLRGRSILQVFKLPFDCQA